MTEGEGSSFKINASMVSLFVGAIAVIYQHTFWSAFNINILQFVSITDLVKLALWPLISFFLMMALGYAFREVQKSPTQVTYKPLPEKIRFLREYRQFANDNPGFVISMGAVVIITMRFFWYSVPIRWIALSFLLSIFTTASLARRKTFEKIYPDTDRRIPALMLVGFVPWLAWGLAKTRADEVLRGIEFDSAQVTPEFLSLAGFAESVELRYLGNTGTYTLFLVGSGPKVVISRNEDTGAVSLVHVKRRFTLEGEFLPDDAKKL